MDGLDVSTVHCARCAGYHAGMLAQALVRPRTLEGRAYTHWYTCPTIEEPVLVAMMVSA